MKPFAAPSGLGGSSWTFNILSPLQSKRLISHSAGLWLLTRTNSASCWLATHTGTAMIGCLAPGGTPLIVCLAYFSHLILMAHTSSYPLLLGIMPRRRGGKTIGVSVCMITCARASERACAPVCVWAKQKCPIHHPAQPLSSPVPFLFLLSSHPPAPPSASSPFLLFIFHIPAAAAAAAAAQIR